MKSTWQNKMRSQKEFWGKYIAISDEEIIFSSKDLDDIIKKIKSTKTNLQIYKVPENPNILRLHPIKIKSLRQNIWEPNYPVRFFVDDNTSIEFNMLIDSGADISVISYNFGLKLGLEKSNHEPNMTLLGVGGKVEFIPRTLEIQIDDYKFENYFAWIQNDEIDEMIIGRHIVFDKFDIEFKQSEEKILFKKR